MLGELLIRNGNQPAAQSALELASRYGHPDEELRALLWLAMLHLERDAMTEAERLLELVVDSGHYDAAPQANVYLGDLLRRAGRVDDAEAAYRAALDSGHPKAATDAAWRFAQLAAGQSKIDEADDWHRQAVARSGDELRLVDEVELGRQFEGAGRHARAETLYRRIQETPDASLRATAQSGQSLAALMATVEYATPGRQPSSSTTRGGVMAGRSIGPRRNDSTRSSSRHSTRSSEGRTALAIADLAIARGDWGEAEEKLELVVELRHEEYAPEAALRLGRRYIQTGRFPDARRVLRQVARYKDPEALREAAEELRGIEGMGPPDPPPAPPTGPPDAPGPGPAGAIGGR
jgi:tetratricopeptide (TPR) repeat protein